MTCKGPHQSFEYIYIYIYIYIYCPVFSSHLFLCLCCRVNENLNPFFRNWFGLVSLFNGISNSVDYSMPLEFELTYRDLSLYSAKSGAFHILFSDPHLYYRFVFTRNLSLVQDVTQGQFFKAEFNRIEFRVFLLLHRLLKFTLFIDWVIYVYIYI